MRSIIVISCLMLLAASGCSKFTGEWLEEGRTLRSGEFVRTTGPRRAAIKFDPAFTMCAGGYIDDAGVVDAQVVTKDTYFTMQNGNVAQFGSVIAKIDGDRMITYIGDEESHQFVRVRGRPSIFPPEVTLNSN